MNSSLHDKRFRRKNPRASIPEIAFPEPYLLTETENTIIEGILEPLNTHGLDLSVYHFQSPARPWEVEPLWARRARLEQQRLPEPFGLRLMRAAKMETSGCSRS